MDNKFYNGVRQVKRQDEVKPGGILIIHFLGLVSEDSGYTEGDRANGRPIYTQSYKTALFEAESMEAAEAYLKDFYERKIKRPNDEDMSIITVGELKKAQVGVVIS